MRLHIFSILFLLSPTTWAEERIIKIPQHMCEEVDIRVVNPSLKEHFSTPRNQGPIGWCYGFAAADLLTSKLGTYISSAHTSAIYNRGVAGNFFWRIGYGIGEIFSGDNLGDFYEGGFIAKALKSAEKMGSVCPENILPYDENYYGEYKNMLLGLDELQSKIQNNSISDEDALMTLKLLLPLSSFGAIDYELVLIEMRNQNLNKVVENVMRVSCKEDLIQIPNLKIINISKPHISKRSTQDFDRSVKRIGSYFEKLNQALDTGTPVGISYRVSPVVNQKGNHASVIIARRFKNGECEFKIRNSWGNSCDSYRPGIECDVSDGSFWVNDDTLYKMSKGITYLE